jgi:hypothetical protein
LAGAIKHPIPARYREALSGPLRDLAKECGLHKDTIGEVRNTGLATSLTFGALRGLFDRCGLPDLQWELLGEPAVDDGDDGPSDPGELAAPARRRTWLDLAGQLECLAGAAAGWDSRVTSAGGARGDADPERACDQLVRDARHSRAFDVMQAATIIKACLRIKSSVAASFARPGRVDSFTLADQLGEIAARPTDPGLGSAALWTRGRLLRELTLLADDPHTRVRLFMDAARTMCRVRGGARLPFRIPLPGMASELNGDEPMLKNAANVLDGMTGEVPTPHRYRAAHLKSAAFEIHLADPGHPRRVGRLLGLAERCTREGRERAGGCGQRWWNMRVVEASVALVRHVVDTRDDGRRSPTAARVDAGVAAGALLGQSMSRMADDRSLSPGAREQYRAELLACEVLLSGEHRERRLHDEVLPLIRASTTRLPRIRSMLPQETVFQHLFMRPGEMRIPFLLTCGFTATEVKRYEQKMVAGWCPDPRNRRPD